MVKSPGCRPHIFCYFLPMNNMPFTPGKIGCLEIKNRFVMSAAVDGLANNLDARIERYAKLAEGGVGLIVAGRVMDKKRIV